MNFFLWLILVFFLLSYGFRLFLRYGMPWLLSRFMKKQQDKFNQAYNQQQGFQQKKKKERWRLTFRRKKSRKKIMSLASI